MMNINRRVFLAELASLGAAVVISEKAPAAEVDAEWSRLLAEPWFFEVGEFGKIVVPGIAEPQTRADIWSIDTTSIKSPSDLVQAVDGVYPLANHFHTLADNEREELEAELESTTESKRRAKLRRLIRDLDGEDGWKTLVEQAKPEDMDRFRKIIDNWLAESVDWDEQEWFPRGSGGQGAAFMFFYSTAADVASDLGVVVIEGDQPGSDYFGAELRNTIEDANEKAEQLGLPFRFRNE